LLAENTLPLSIWGGISEIQRLFRFDLPLLELAPNTAFGPLFGVLSDHLNLPLLGLALNTAFEPLFRVLSDHLN
jgi:hypothetical protein